MARFRPRTGDFLVNGRIYDVYDIKKAKKDAEKAKQKLLVKYQRVRIVKRGGEYNVLIDSHSERKIRMIIPR